VGYPAQRPDGYIPHLSSTPNPWFDGEDHCPLWEPLLRSQSVESLEMAWHGCIPSHGQAIFLSNPIDRVSERHDWINHVFTKLKQDLLGIVTLTNQHLQISTEMSQRGRYNSSWYIFIFNSFSDILTLVIPKQMPKSVNETWIFISWKFMNL
jgi:hypothetical protein